MASYVDITNILNFAVAFKPTSAFPLDARSMFGSYSAAVAAASTAAEPGSSDSIYYIGQTLTVYENDVVASYQIQPDKTLKAIGANVIPDDKTIVLDNNDTLSLKSFGVQYFKYIHADNVIQGSYTYPDGMPQDATAGDFVKIGETYYKYDGSDWTVADAQPVLASRYELTAGWKAGLEPKVIQNADSSYELAWYEPSTTTVEGLQSAVASLSTKVDTIDSKVDANKAELEGKISDEVTRATEAEGALNTRVTTNTNDINTLKADASTEGSVLNSISKAIDQVMNNPDASMNSIQELVTWTQEHAADALELSNSVTANATAIKALEDLLGTSLPEDAQATTVIDYIVEKVGKETTRATNAEKALSDRIDSLETANSKLGTAAQKNVEDFATAAQGQKADTAVQSVVKGTGNGKISVDGTEIEVYAPTIADITTPGVIKPDGTSISVDSNGVASVTAVDVSKVTGLDTKLEEIQNGAESNTKNYIDENFVAKTNIAGTTNIADTLDGASNAKVVSEKAFLNALIWKTTM